jgi:hypothetical protein
MASWLEIDERVVRSFRETEGISRQARIALTAGLHRDLREHGDALRQVPELLLAPGSSCFRYEIVLQDTDRMRVSASSSTTPVPSKASSTSSTPTNFFPSPSGGFAADSLRRNRGRCTQSLVVWAINEGRGAAREGDRFLMGRTDLP